MDATLDNFFEEGLNVPDSDNNLKIYHDNSVLPTSTATSSLQVLESIKSSAPSSLNNSSNNIKSSLGFYGDSLRSSSCSNIEKDFSCDPSDQQFCAENQVFVGGVSKSVSNQDIENLFNTCGEILQVKLIKDKNGQSKGYGFVTFQDKSNCKLAVDTFNGKEFQGKKLRVKQSENKRKLFMGNLPKEMNREQLMESLNQHTEGIANVDFLMDPDNPTRNRGFAFIEFTDYYYAEKALKTFSNPSFRIANTTSNITVNWADPVQEPDKDVMQNVRVLYIRNLPEERSEQEIRTIFENYGPVEKIIIPQDIPGQQRRDFAFVHFETRESAEKALSQHTNVSRIQYQKRDLVISFAKPIDKKQRAELRIRKLIRTVNRQQTTIVNPTIGSGAMSSAAAAVALMGSANPGLLHHVTGIPTSTLPYHQLLPGAPTQPQTSSTNPFAQFYTHGAPYIPASAAAGYPPTSSSSSTSSSASTSSLLPFNHPHHPHHHHYSSQSQHPSSHYSLFSIPPLESIYGGLRTYGGSSNVIQAPSIPRTNNKSNTNNSNSLNKRYKPY